MDCGDIRVATVVVVIIAAEAATRKVVPLVSKERDAESIRSGQRACSKDGGY